MTAPSAVAARVWPKMRRATLLREAPRGHADSNFASALRDAIGCDAVDPEAG